MNVSPEEKQKTPAAVTQKNILMIPTSLITFNSKERSTH